ncbi:hypothetical protein K502DRAFT_368885 [Neoconidiobolus thromboides FSU 785]|nr:hypothetical protein K502DRAFT_368885 [Neoconidiobolus thromboides FSU 785]
MQRSAYRKRKSSLANVLQPLQASKKNGLPTLAEDEPSQSASETNELRFEPSTLPDSSLTDLFNNTSTTEDIMLNSANTPNSSNKLGFPIFTQQFIDLHRTEENELVDLVNKVNQSRRTSKMLQQKNNLAIQQSQVSSKSIKELRSNNQQIKGYLNNFKTELKPLLTQLENGLPKGNNKSVQNEHSTQELIHYLKDLGRRIWEFGPDDENLNEQVTKPSKA